MQLTQEKKQAYIKAYAGFLLYSLSMAASKRAMLAPLFSGLFFIFISLALLGMLLYALIWQQVLKTLPLVEAYAHKGSVILLGLFWGAVLFYEHIGWNKLLGAGIILLGLFLVVRDDQ